MLALTAKQYYYPSFRLLTLKETRNLVQLPSFTTEENEGRKDFKTYLRSQLVIGFLVII